MSKKIQIKISNISGFDAKRIEKILKEKFNNEFKNFFHQKDKRNNLTIFFSIKNDINLLHKLKEFFKKTNWKLSHD